MERNDYDRVANQAESALAVLIGNTHGPLIGSDSVTVTKDGWINSVVGIQRAIDYCRGLATAHTNTPLTADAFSATLESDRVQPDL